MQNTGPSVFTFLLCWNCDIGSDIPVMNDLMVKLQNVIFTFRVSRRPREMYCGHARLCVCLCVCPRPHA